MFCLYNTGLCFKMSDKDCQSSDSEEGMEGNDPKEPESPLQDVSSPDTQTESSDVAPTRKTRRRPENKAPDGQESVDTPSPSENIPTTFTSTTVSQGGWGSWGSWGKSLLSSATATVATVGKSLHSSCFFVLVIRLRYLYLFKLSNKMFSKNLLKSKK